MNSASKFMMYQRLFANKAKIYEEARKAGDELGIPDELKGKIGLASALSGRPGELPVEMIEAMGAANRKTIPLAELVEDLREIVKEVYGDEYDAAPINSCEAALCLAFDVLAAPPMLGRGENYRTRVVAPYERHMHHQAAFGRPFPPKYKALIANRGVTSGELGMEGKRLNNLDTIIVPLVGAKYKAHGIKRQITPMLSKVDPEASVEKIAQVAERHAAMLTAFTSLGFDTPGYGYGIKDEDGAPKLSKLIGKLAGEHNVPYIVDNAFGIPFIGTDLRKINADVIMYSMDKAVPCPTGGLIIGREDVMIPIQQALGIHGERWGTLSSYGKAAYVTFDPGKDAIVGQITMLKILRDHPKRITESVDKSYKIVKEEFEIHSKFKSDILISKTYNSGAVEINYDRTWKEEELGIPIFSIEDFYAGTDLIGGTLKNMGIVPCVSYDAEMLINPGLGTTDENGNLIEERMRYAIRALSKTFEIICKYAGVV